MSSDTKCKNLQYSDGVNAEHMAWQTLHSSTRLSVRHLPNLFDYYKLFTPSGGFDGLHFWGAYDSTGNQLGGLTGLVNSEINLPVQGVTSYYNCESFVLPDERGRGLHFALMTQLYDFFRSLKSLTFTWGVEMTHGTLDGMKRFMDSLGGIDTEFPGTTRGFHIFLKALADHRLREPGYKKIFLKDMSALERKEYLVHLRTYGSQSPFYPRFTDTFFDRILQLDPQAHFICLSGQNEAALLAVNIQPVRQYYRDEPAKPVRALHWSCIWSRSGEGMDRLVSAAYHDALETGFEIAVARDLPLSSVKFFPEVLMTLQRVFTITWVKDRLAWQGVTGKFKNVQLDSLFI